MTKVLLSDFKIMEGDTVILNFLQSRENTSGRNKQERDKQETILRYVIDNLCTECKANKFATIHSLAQR